MKAIKTNSTIQLSLPAILVVFLLGVASQLIGVLYSVFDALMSHKIYAYESRHAMLLENQMWSI